MMTSSREIEMQAAAASLSERLGSAAGGAASRLRVSALSSAVRVVRANGETRSFWAGAYS